MTTEQILSVAHTIAERLSHANTDHNELAKASAFLNHTRDAKAFFTWLDWMATPRVSEKLARSRQTPEYYRQIRDACQQLRPIADVDEMAQTLGWAVRLMRYIPYARPIDPKALAATLESRQAGQPATAPPERRPPGTRAGSGPSRIADLRPGLELAGTVKRTANYGAFVDVGVGRDGLVHISKLKAGYVDNVESVVKVGQQVTVWVESVDPAQGKISLTMIRPKAATRMDELTQAAPPIAPTQPPKPAKLAPPPRPQTVWLAPGDKPVAGQWIKGKVTAIEHNRLVVDIRQSQTASLMFEFLPGQPDQEWAEEHFAVGQEIEAKVRRINQQGRVQLTMRED